MPACICNNIHYKAWDEITNPFPIINGTTVEVLEWISILKPHFTVHVIILPYLGLKLIHVNRWGRGRQCVKGNTCIYKNIVGISQHCQSVETKLPTNDADLNAYMPWWRHQMETFSVLLALCAGNSPVTGEFPSQRPVTRSIDILFDLRLNKRLSKQRRRRWFEKQIELIIMTSL